MDISVVIPTYNSGLLATQAVESVLAQTHPASQIIVVDDGSTDDTPGRMRRFGRRVEYIRQSNARVAAARNTGLSHASGDFVAFLDADDYWHPRKLQRQCEVWQQRPQIGLLATDCFSWPGELPELAEHDSAPLEIVRLSQLLVFNSLTTSSVVVRRPVLEEAGHFDTDLFGPEDYDLWLRCAHLAPAAVLHEPLVGYRDTSGSLGKQAETMRRGLLRIHEKLDAASAWPSAIWRRRCRAHLDYSTGYLYFAAGQPTTAVKLLAQSLLAYPLPMSPTEVRYRCGRFRLLARAAWQGCRQLLPRVAEASS